MKTILHKFKVILLVTTTLLLAFSCSNDLENRIEQEQNISSTDIRSIIDIDSQTSAIDQIITDLFVHRNSGKSAKLEDCYHTTYSDSGYIVTFNNCSVNGSEKITGSLQVTYVEQGEKSSFTALYTDITIGAIVINGTRDFTIKNTFHDDEVSLDIVTDLSIQLEDGSVVNEKGTKNLTISYDAENFRNSSLEIYGDWSVMADGNTYAINITSPLTTNILTCSYISKGILNLNKNGLGVTVDFGDGTCDEVATLTDPNGSEEEISLKED